MTVAILPQLYHYGEAFLVTTEVNKLLPANPRLRLDNEIPVVSSRNNANPFCRFPTCPDKLKSSTYTVRHKGQPIAPVTGYPPVAGWIDTRN